ncbi:hypothetical protein [Ottowia sp. VDI28]|uniref:hypothetical protein n=1 Tax=Ottowia sp. VDI28 TaxID=3133968 RepID=UPI003C2D289B
METDRGTLGDLQIFVRARQAGRPITLEGTGSGAWMTLAEIEALKAWASIPAAQFTLHLRGTSFTVMFDHTRQPAIDAKPAWPLLDGEEAPDLEMLPTFKFIEI